MLQPLCGHALFYITYVKYLVIIVWHAENVNIEDDTTATHGRHDGTRSRSAVVIRNAIAQYLNNRNEL